MTRRVRFTLALAGVAAAVFTLAGCGSSSSSSSSATASELNGSDSGGVFQGVGLSPAQPRPAFTLTDTAGKSFAFSTATAGHPTLLYFGYTNCPDVCPTTMADVEQALAKVPASVAKQTYVVFVSTDVKRDTSAVIARWLSNFDAGSKAHWVGLRGTQAQVDLAQAASHVTLAEDGGEQHSAQLNLYGPDNYAHVQYLQSTHEADQIAHDLPLVDSGTKG